MCHLAGSGCVTSENCRKGNGNGIDNKKICDECDLIDPFEAWQTVGQRDKTPGWCDKSPIWKQAFYAFPHSANITILWIRFYAGTSHHIDNRNKYVNAVAGTRNIAICVVCRHFFLPIHRM